MNLLSKTSKLDPAFFLNDKKTFTSFEILSSILPPLSIQYKKDSFKSTESYETSNQVVEIVNGIIKRGQLDKDTQRAVTRLFVIEELLEQLNLEI